MAKKPSANEVVSKIETSDLVAFGEALPDYLQDQAQSTGLEGLGKDDFKRPRLVMLQALSPQVKARMPGAIPGEFWHNIANISLGNEFRMVMLKASKRVILWKPEWDGGGILAFSEDGLNWKSGANSSFNVHPVKNAPNTVTWKTGRNVPDSRLLDWGSFNPENEGSPPAATLIYEYLVYLVDRPELSPIVLGCYKTSIGNAKAFNTNLLGLRKPTTAIMARCYAEEMHEGSNSWFVPAFETIGWCSKDMYQEAEAIKAKFADYETDYDPSEINQTDKSEAPIDEIKY